MKRRLIVRFALAGLCLAVVLAAVRLYMVVHEPQYDDVLYGAWFDNLTLIFWPSAFYLTVLQEKESPATITTVVGIAVLVNPVIYVGVGWLIWRISSALGVDQQQ